MKCNGKMENGPGKQFTRCPKCGGKDSEQNEGDLCGRPIGGAKARSKAESTLSEAEWVVYQTNRKDELRFDSKGVMSLGSATMLLIFPKGFEVPEDPSRTLVWQGSAKNAIDGINIASRHAKRDASLKESVATMRALFVAEGDDGEFDLPEDPWRYFTKTPSAELVPVEKIQTTRARPDGIVHAAQLMAMAYSGEADKRPPITVRRAANGTYTVRDGNSTTAVARRCRWKMLPVEVLS